MLVPWRVYHWLLLDIKSQQISLTKYLRNRTGSKNGSGFGMLNHAKVFETQTPCMSQNWRYFMRMSQYGPTEEILHHLGHLRLVVYPNIYRVLYIPGGFPAEFPNHQQ